MSRVGRKPITIPSAVKVNVQGSTVTVKGPRGELKQTFDPVFKITTDKGVVAVETPDDKMYDAKHGLTRAIINNMVVGVTDGYKRTLEVEGVGYRAELQGKALVMSVGFSHQVTFEPPAGITFTVDKNQRLFSIEGPDKQLVGEMASKIRSTRPPEPYKGKGIHYLGERIRRKAGKAGKAGAK
jgi:large subunit ribosomal protein L6